MWGGGSCQIMVGQLYMLVVSGLYLLVIYGDAICSYFCFFFLFLFIKSPIDSVLIKYLNIRDGSISTSSSVKYSAKPVVMPCLVHCSHHSLNPCLSGTTTGIPGVPALDFVEFFPPSSRFLRTSCFESHSTLSFSPCISFIFLSLYLTRTIVRGQTHIGPILHCLTCILSSLTYIGYILYATAGIGPTMYDVAYIGPMLYIQAHIGPITLG